MYFELFIAAGLLCLGEIVFGRFEEGSSKGRRIRKMAVFFGVTALLSHYAGRAAALAWVFGAMALGLGRARLVDAYERHPVLRSGAVGPLPRAARLGTMKARKPDRSPLSHFRTLALSHS